MKELECLKEMYLEEIKRINKKGELTPVDAEAAKKALEAIDLINEICRLEGDSGYSERRMSYGPSSWFPPIISNQRYYGVDDRGMYQAGDDGRGMYSDRRGRSSTTGRYVSRGRDDTVDNMIHRLEHMMDETSDDRVRMAIDSAITKLETY